MAPSWHVENLQGGLAPSRVFRASSEQDKLLQEHQTPHSDLARGSRFNIEQEDTGHDDLATLAPGHKAASRFIILPQSTFRKRWMQITLVVAMYIIWVTPIRVGFDMQAQGPWFWIEGIIDIFFYVDLVLNFLTAYEHPVTNELITDHKKIAIRYLSSWFWIDLLATFPSDYIVRGMEGTWGCSFRDTCDPMIQGDTPVSIIVLLRTMRIFRVFWIFKNFNVLSVTTVIGRLMDEYITVRWLFSIAELLVVLIFLGHMCGCFFYMFSHPRWQTPVERQLIQDGDMSNWIIDKLGAYETTLMPTVYQGAENLTQPTDRSMQDPATGVWYECPLFFSINSCANCQGVKLRCESQFNFAFRYISSMYWAYTTMTTVGYGDICGVTIAEKVWAMITMVIGGFFLSFCFGRIASIVSRLDADRATRAEKMETVTQFLRDTELPKPLARKVLDFFKRNIKSVKPYDRGDVLGRLPFDLRSRILQHLYMETIQNIPVLDKIAKEEESFLTDFTMRLSPYHTSADTYVYHKGETTTDMYIAVRGELQVLDVDKKPLFRLAEGTIFGEPGVLRTIEGKSKPKREETIYCTTPCDMLRLTAEDASELCDLYPQLLRGLRRLERARQHRLATIRSHGEIASLERQPSSVGADAAAHGTTPLHPRPESARLSHAGSGTLSVGHAPSLDAHLEPMLLAMQQQQAQQAAEIAQLRAMLQQLPAELAKSLQQQGQVQ